MTERQKLFLLSTRVSNCTPGWPLRTIDIKILKKENSLRRKIEKKLQCVAEKELDLSNEFQDISECKKNVILSVLSNVSVLNGLYFEQLWYVDNQNVLYNGHIMCKAIQEVSSS